MSKRGEDPSDGPSGQGWDNVDSTILDLEEIKDRAIFDCVFELVFVFYLRNAESLEKIMNITKILARESHNYQIESNQNDVIQCFSNAEEEDAGWYTRYLLSLENSLNSPNGAISMVTGLNHQRFDYCDTSTSTEERQEKERHGLQSVLNCHINPGTELPSFSNEYLLPKMKLTIKSDYISKYSSFNIEGITE